ncbi:MAG: hypothetical protein P4L40_07615, partial [Terracidiphilus sp.]|nr:hypothetical protein [Terracidiphilus sp.]
MSANSPNSPPPGGDASARKRIGGPNRPPSTHKFGANKQTRLSPQPIPQAASPLQNSLVQQFQAHYMLDARDAVPTPSEAINESRDSSVDQSDTMVDASVVDTSSSTASSSFVTSTASTESTPQKPMLGGIFASMDSPSVVTPSVVQQSLNSPPPAAASTSTSTTAVSSPCVNSPGKPKIVLVGDNSPSACFAPKRCQSSPVSDLTAAMDMAAIWGRYAADPSLAERLADIACIADDGERCAAIALLVQKQCEQFEVEVQRAAEVALANERAEKAALQQRLEALQLIEAKFAAVSHRPPDDTAHAKEQLEKQLLEKINELEVQSQEKKKYKAKYKE